MLRRITHGRYWPLKYSPRTTFYIGSFLGEEVRGDYEEFLEAFEEPLGDGKPGLSYDCWIENGMVFIFPDWHSTFQECMKKDCYGLLPLELFLEILRPWGAVYRQQPRYIFITIIEDIVEVTGTNTWINNLHIDSE